MQKLLPMLRAFSDKESNPAFFNFHDWYLKGSGFDNGDGQIQDPYKAEDPFDSISIALMNLLCYGTINSPGIMHTLLSKQPNLQTVKKGDKVASVFAKNKLKRTYAIVHNVFK